MSIKAAADLETLTTRNNVLTVVEHLESIIPGNIAIKAARILENPTHQPCRTAPLPGNIVEKKSGGTKVSPTTNRKWNQKAYLFTVSFPTYSSGNSAIELLPEDVFSIP